MNEDLPEVTPSRLSSRVIAVVVTYNRKQLLAEVLQALSAQTVIPEAVILVDNCSTDGTSELIGSIRIGFPLRYMRMERNFGGAGGFHAGLKEAYGAGAAWLWCMDDDCIPRPDALERLLTAAEDPMIGRDAGFLASRVLWTDGSPCLMNLPVAHPLWIQPLGTHCNLTRIVGSSLVSMLVSRTAVEAVGLPVKEFFIWFDDAEFSRRISREMPAYLVHDSVVIHKTPKNFGPMDFDYLDAGNLWKYRLGVRNECAFHLRNGGVVSAVLFMAMVLRRMLRSRCSWRLYAPIGKALLGGLLFNYPKLIEFPQAGRHAGQRTEPRGNS